MFRLLSDAIAPPFLLDSSPTDTTYIWIIVLSVFILAAVAAIVLIKRKK